MKNRQAFTMVELIFVIVIIGVLASMAIPKLSGLTDGAKKSAEIATISALSTAIETTNGEWTINESTFTWGIGGNPSSELDPNGYPSDLEKNGKVFGKVLKDSGNFQKITSNLDSNLSIFKGPASNPKNGAKFDLKAPNSDIQNRPDKNDFWVYSYGSNDCNLTCNNCISETIYYGDLVLIDVTGKTSTNFSTLTCN